MFGVLPFLAYGIVLLVYCTVLVGLETTLWVNNVQAFVMSSSRYNGLVVPKTYMTVLCAHKAGTGNTRNGRDGNPKFLGLKKTHNSFVYTGNIIVRQRGAKFKPGIGAKMGRDHTIYASRCGKLQILRRRVSVLDLTAEEDQVNQNREYYEHPTIVTLSRLWTEKV